MLTIEAPSSSADPLVGAVSSRRAQQIIGMTSVVKTSTNAAAPANSGVGVAQSSTADLLLDRMLCAPPPPPPLPSRQQQQQQRPPPTTPQAAILSNQQHQQQHQQNRWLVSTIGHAGGPADLGISTPEAVSNSSSGVSLSLPPASVCRQQQQQQQQQQQLQQQQKQQQKQLIHQTNLEREWSRRISAGLCPHCDAPAATEEQRHFHERVHAMDELYRCQLCSCRFAYPCSLQMHVALHSDRSGGGFLQPPQQHQQQQQQQQQQHYPEHQDLTPHPLASYQQQQQQQQQQQYAAAGGKMTLPASHQHQQYHQLHQQPQQQQQQLAPHVCPHCNKGYIRAGNLRNHMLRFHPY